MRSISPKTSTFMYQKELLGMQPSKMQMIMGLIALPWCIKPVFGYFVDQTIQKIRYAKFLVLAIEATRIVVLMCLGSFNMGPWMFYLSILINSMCTLLENIICEYTLVVSSKQANEAEGSTHTNHLPIFFGFRALGSLLGNFYGGRVIKYYPIRTAYRIAAFFPMIPIVFALAYAEQPRQAPPHKRSFGQELSLMKDVIVGENVLQLLVFVFFINLAPNFDIVFTYYMTDFLKFSTEDLANFSTVAALCYVVGLYIYTMCGHLFKPKRFFICTNFMLWVVNASFFLVVSGLLRQWNISEKGFCLLTQGVYSLVAELNYMPIIALWCAVCPKNLEATSITLFTGLMNFSNNLSMYLGSGLSAIFGIKKENFDRVYILVLFQNAYLLLAMVAVLWADFPELRKPPGEAPTDLETPVE